MPPVGAARRPADLIRQSTKWAAIGLMVAASCIVFVLLQVRHIESALVRSGTRVIGRTLGMDVAVAGTLEAHLLPRPHVVLTAVHVRDARGVADLDIGRLEATQSLSSLLAGHISFSRFRVDDVTATLDADRLGDGLQAPALGHFLPERIVMTDAVVAIRSSHPAARGLLTGFSGVLEGLDRNGSASLSGHGLWRGQHLDATARLAPVFDFVRGRETVGSLKVQMPSLTASVDGKLSLGVHGGFTGDVAVSTPSLATLLAEGGFPPTLGRMVDRVAFRGSGVANRNNITFSDAHLSLDDIPFVGSLAWQPNEAHGAWTGTFAADTLDLTRAVASLPQLRDGSTHWSDRPWRLDPSILGDVDLRISAAKARIGAMEIEDAAFSAMCRDGRIEASLSEARTGDGMIRGRAVASLAPQALDLKFDMSVSQVDLAPVFAALGQQDVAGTASGHVAGTAHGNSARTLAESLSGRGQISVRQGSLPTLAMHPAEHGLARLWRGGRDASIFDLVAADLDIQGDRVALAHGRFISPASQEAFSGTTSLLDQSFRLVLPADGATPAGALLNVSGSWDPVLRVTQASASLPAGRVTAP